MFYHTTKEFFKKKKQQKEEFAKSEAENNGEVMEKKKGFTDKLFSVGFLMQVMLTCIVLGLVYYLNKI